MKNIIWNVNEKISMKKFNTATQFFVRRSAVIINLSLQTVFHVCKWKQAISTLSTEHARLFLQLWTFLNTVFYGIHLTLALSFLHWQLSQCHFWCAVTLDTSKEAQMAILFLPLGKTSSIFQTVPMPPLLLALMILERKFCECRFPPGSSVITRKTNW